MTTTSMIHLKTAAMTKTAKNMEAEIDANHFLIPMLMQLWLVTICNILSLAILNLIMSCLNPVGSLLVVILCHLNFGFLLNCVTLGSDGVIF